MANLAQQRIKKELREIHKSTEAAQNTIKILQDDANIMNLRGEIVGPPDTPYEGATFRLDIQIPDNYPFVPPKVKFVNRIWHPNISSATGVICLDILKDQWAAAMSLRTVLLSIQALLASAEPDDPQDAVVASQFKNNRNIFELTARHWASVYANGPHREKMCDAKIKQLQEMGFGESEARSALSTKDWDLEKATEYILK